MKNSLVVRITSVVVFFITAGVIPSAFAKNFVHPGSWLTQADIDRIRTNVAQGKEPWKSAWNALKKSEADIHYTAHPKEIVTDGYEMQNDGHAAWVLAVKWIASGDKAYADAAIKLINAWGGTVKSLPNDTLRTGLGATQMINAAELLRYANRGSAGWKPDDVAKFEKLCKTLLYPVVKQNGGGGWGTPCLSAMVALGVFTNDRAIYEQGKSMFMENRRETDPGCDKSCLREYVFDNGQNGDSYRDQGHSQGALAHLAECAETAWNQGDDLWAAYDNLLLKGYEYVAKYNLGNDVDFIPYTDGNGNHKNSISTAGRGSFSPMYEIAYNHYVKRKGLKAPYTRQVCEKYAPEKTNGDNCGMGTLIFTRETTDPLR